MLEGLLGQVQVHFPTSLSCHLHFGLMDIAHYQFAKENFSLFLIPEQSIVIPLNYFEEKQFHGKLYEDLPVNQRYQQITQFERTLIQLIPISTD